MSIRNGKAGMAAGGPACRAVEMARKAPCSQGQSGRAASTCCLVEQEKRKKIKGE